jgi:chromosomal replication initiation ATPase DnaA
MSVPEQIALPLPLRVAMGVDDFMVSSSNENAVRMIDTWPQWPAHCLILAGEVGSGKTHLAHIWRSRSCGVFVTPLLLGNREQMQQLLETSNNFVIDGAEAYFGLPQNEEVLFHFYNNVRERGGHMLLIVRQPAVQQTIGLLDLASRLRASPAVTLLPPDDVLLAAMLVKQFKDRQINVDVGVIDYILPRIERSACAVSFLVQQLDKASLMEQRRITSPLVRRFL